MSSILKIHAPRDLVETNFWYDVAKNITIAHISELLQYYPSENVKNDQFYTNFKSFISDYFQQYNSLASGLTGDEYEYCRLLCYWIGKHAVPLQSIIEKISVVNPNQSVLLGTVKNRYRWMFKMTLHSISKLKEQKEKMKNDSSLVQFTVIMTVLCANDKSKLPDEPLVASIIEKTTLHATTISQYHKNYAAKKTIIDEAKKNVIKTELSSKSTHKTMPDYLKLSAISPNEFTRLENISKKTGSYTVFDNVMKLQTMRRDSLPPETTSMPTTITAATPPPVTTVVPVAQKPATTVVAVAQKPATTQPTLQNALHPLPQPQPPGPYAPPPPPPPGARPPPPPPSQQGLREPPPPAAPATNKTEMNKSQAQTGVPKNQTVFEICTSKYGTDSLDPYMWEGSPKTCPTSNDSQIEMFARQRQLRVHQKKSAVSKNETGDVRGSTSDASTRALQNALVKMHGIKLPRPSRPELKAEAGNTLNAEAGNTLKEYMSTELKIKFKKAGGNSESGSETEWPAQSETTLRDIGTRVVDTLMLKNEESNGMISSIFEQNIGAAGVERSDTTLVAGSTTALAVSGALTPPVLPLTPPVPPLTHPVALVEHPVAPVEHPVALVEHPVALLTPPVAPVERAVATIVHPISDISSINSTDVGPAVAPAVSGDAASPSSTMLAPISIPSSPHSIPSPTGSRVSHSEWSTPLHASGSVRIQVPNENDLDLLMSADFD